MKQTKYIQQVTGSFLNYGRVADPLILHALSKIASQQYAPTENTLKQAEFVLDYMSWHSQTFIQLYASDMILQIHSDASYLTVPKARSRVGEHVFLRVNPR